jgi:hypothetical protein
MWFFKRKDAIEKYEDLGGLPQENVLFNITPQHTCHVLRAGRALRTRRKFWDAGTSLLIYMNGRIVAYGRRKSEAYMIYVVRLGLFLVRLVASSNGAPEISVKTRDGMPVMESMVVTCSNMHSLHGLLASDVLWIDKLALRHGRRLIEVCTHIHHPPYCIMSFTLPSCAVFT